MEVSIVVRKNTYYDSVTLMLITKDVKEIEGVKEVLVGMGTDLNKELAENLNISTDEIRDLTPNDFFITVLSEDASIMDEVVNKVDELLSKKKSESGSEYRPLSLESALDYQPDSNMVLISVPGEYAAEEAKKALDNNLHVMLFSDNVSIEDELKLKDLAVEKGLLMMGPDCGTAIINNVPLAFANVVKNGPIGIVGASGTGTQEITVIIDKLGCGVSQVIGTGGRDLRSEIGGLMMLQGIEALSKDPNTEVIVLVSKPPAEEVAEKVLKAAASSGKPVVVDFIGGNTETIKKRGLYPALTLEDAAHKAVAILNNEEVKDYTQFSINEDELRDIVNRELKKLNSNQKYLRGLFTGGTLADEAMNLLSSEVGDIYSNIPLSPELKLKDINTSIENTIIDLGEDEFTVGKPHPMIEPMSRVDRIVKEAQDSEVGIILMDFVLGYGSNDDPVGAMLPSIEKAKAIAKENGNELSVIASICGTENDPQDYYDSKKRLEDYGVIVMPSNAQAVRLTAKILKNLNK